MKIKKKPLSIYIHIPFCKKKCLYCDFLSAPACGQERESYVKALLHEISFMAEKASEYEVISVFFGGGTPSLLNRSQMDRIMSAIRKGYCLAQDCEITIECNPATADYDKLAFFKACGINRLSIGLQSANDKELKELGRIHNYKQFLATFEAARKAGFTNINIDIMSALPGQTFESYTDTLQKVISLNPEHISAYSLIIEEGTPFYERYGEQGHSEDTAECRMLHVPLEAVNEAAQSMNCAPIYPALPNEDIERKMYHRTKAVLQKAGYERYEISNYAKKGYECRHNLTYWTGVDYLGVGIGAASYFEGYRFKNCADIGKYQECFSGKSNFLLYADKRSADICELDLKTVLHSSRRIFHGLHEEIQLLTMEEQMEEFMFLGLRLKRGISTYEFEQHFGRSLESVYEKVIDRFIKEKLLLKKDDRIYLSRRGMDVANYVMSEFLLK